MLWEIVLYLKACFLTSDYDAHFHHKEEIMDKYREIAYELRNLLNLNMYPIKYTVIDNSWLKLDISTKYLGHAIIFPLWSKQNNQMFYLNRLGNIFHTAKPDGLLQIACYEQTLNNLLKNNHIDFSTNNIFKMQYERVMRKFTAMKTPKEIIDIFKHVFDSTMPMEDAHVYCSNENAKLNTYVSIPTMLEGYEIPTNDCELHFSVFVYDAKQDKMYSTDMIRYKQVDETVEINNIKVPGVIKKEFSAGAIYGMFIGIPMCIVVISTIIHLAIKFYDKRRLVKEENEIKESNRKINY